MTPPTIPQNQIDNPSFAGSGEVLQQETLSVEQFSINPSPNLPIITGEENKSLEQRAIAPVEDQLPVLPRTLSRRAARVVSSVASPPILSTLLILLSALDLGGIRMWQWIVMQVSTSMVVPCIYVFFLARRGKISDVEIYHRRQRYLPNLVFLGSGLISWLLLLYFNAPIELVMVSGAGLLLLFIISAVTYLYKISAHVAAASIFAFIMWRLAGNALLLSIIPIMAWSRLTLHRHTRGQVVAGFFAAVVVFGVIFLI